MAQYTAEMFRRAGANNTRYNTSYQAIFTDNDGASGGL